MERGSRICECCRGVYPECECTARCAYHGPCNRLATTRKAGGGGQASPRGMGETHMTDDNQETTKTVSVSPKKTAKKTKRKASLVAIVRTILSRATEPMRLVDIVEKAEKSWKKSGREPAARFNGIVYHAANSVGIRKDRGTYVLNPHPEKAKAKAKVAKAKVAEAKAKPKPKSGRTAISGKKWARDMTPGPEAGPEATTLG